MDFSTCPVGARPAETGSRNHADAVPHFIIAIQVRRLGRLQVDDAGAEHAQAGRSSVHDLRSALGTLFFFLCDLRVPLAHFAVKVS